MKTAETFKHIARSTNRFSILALLLVLFLASCDHDSKGQANRESTAKSTGTIKKDSLEPRVDIKVNRHFDDKGNMIGYDSTYSSFYLNTPGDTSQMYSMMKNFRQSLPYPSPMLYNKDLSRNDSMFFPSFNFDQLFQPRPLFQDNFFSMRNHMDSVMRSMERDLQSRNNKESNDL